jgi:hypothetical protein
MQKKTKPGVNCPKIPLKWAIIGDLRANDALKIFLCEPHLCRKNDIAARQCTYYFSFLQIATLDGA